MQNEVWEPIRHAVEAKIGARFILAQGIVFAQQPERFCGHLDTLTELRGKEAVSRWKALARGGQWAEAFSELMRDHYDPLYLRSMQRNFAGVADALQLILPDGGPAATRDAARSLAARPAR